MRLHRASISAVLPEPTGPPMPTRSGPWGDDVMSGTASNTGFHAEESTAAVGAQRAAAKVVQPLRLRHNRGGMQTRHQPCGDPLPIGLADDAEPHRGRDEIGDEGGTHRLRARRRAPPHARPKLQPRRQDGLRRARPARSRPARRRARRRAPPRRRRCPGSPSPAAARRNSPAPAPARPLRQARPRPARRRLARCATAKRIRSLASEPCRTRSRSQSCNVCARHAGRRIQTPIPARGNRRRRRAGKDGDSQIIKGR